MGFDHDLRGDSEPAGRWERLFVDLTSEFDEADALVRADEVSDRTRRENAQLRLVDRLRAAQGSTITAVVASAGPITGTIRGVGPDWLLLAAPLTSEALIPHQAISSVTGMPWLSAVPGSEGEVAAKLDFRFALRRLARDRAFVRLTNVDSLQLAGTIDRVGADFLELAEHAAGDPRRTRSVVGVRAIPLAAIAVVRGATASSL